MSSFKKNSQHLLVVYRKLPQRERAIFWVFVMVLVLLLFPAFTNIPGVNKLHKAHMYFLNPPQKAGVGQAFPLELRLTTSGTPINAVGAVISYNSSYLEVLNMTTDTSFCSFYLEHTFDNIKGEVHISCGLPNPGFQGDSVIVHLNMRPKIPGNTQVKVLPGEARVLANTGKGENVIDQAPQFNLDITQLF